MRKIVGSLSLLVLLLNTLLTPITYAQEYEEVIEVSSENEEAEVEENGEEEDSSEFSVEEENGDEENTEENDDESDEEETNEEEEGTEENEDGDATENEDGDSEGDTEETGDAEGETGSVVEGLTGASSSEEGTGEVIKYNETPITGERTYGDVTVRVEALTGIFPEWTELVIEPIKWWNLWSLKDQLVEGKQEVKEDTTVVAFDITFIYSGEEVQPKEGEKVKVTFDYSSNKELTDADENEEQEVKVYHIEDKDGEGNKVEDEEKKIRDVTNVEESKEEGIAVADGESFSIYALTIVENNPNTITLDGKGGELNSSTNITDIVCDDQTGLCTGNVAPEGGDIRFPSASRENAYFLGWIGSGASAGLSTLTKNPVLPVATVVGQTYKAKYTCDYGYVDINDECIPLADAPANGIVYDSESQTITVWGNVDGTKMRYTIQDRNVGATETGAYNVYTDAARGKYFQYGNNNGLYRNQTHTFLDNSVNVGNIVPSTYSGSLVRINKFPYVTTNGTGYLNIWGYYSKINDWEARRGPCPVGYHVPSDVEFKNILKTLGSTTWQNALSQLWLPGVGWGYDNGTKLGTQKDCQNDNKCQGKYHQLRIDKPSTRYYVAFESDKIGSVTSSDANRYYPVRCFQNYADCLDGQVKRGLDCLDFLGIKITFDANGGTVLGDDEYVTEDDEAIINLSNYTAEKPGYYFVGWNTDKNATRGLTGEKTYTSNTTLYAIYLKLYTYTFVDTGGNVLGTGYYESGVVSDMTKLLTLNYYSDETGDISHYTDLLTLGLDDPSKGWKWTPSLPEDGIATGNLILHGEKVNKYTVTFNNDDGTDFLAYDVIDGTIIKEPVNHPEKVGYTFLGWYEDEELTTKFDFSTKTITGNTTIYPGFTEVLCTFTTENVTAGLKITGFSGTLTEECLTHFVIPSKIGGKIVKQIGYRAFKGKSISGEIILPDTVTYIGEEAFANNEISGKLKLPNNIENIDKSAFYNNKISGQLDLPESLTKVGVGAFATNNISGRLVIPGRINNGVVGSEYRCNPIEEVIFGIGTTEITKEAFADHSTICNDSTKHTIKHVEFPSTLQIIRNLAFNGQIIEGELELPNSLTIVEDGAFGGNKISGILRIPGSVTTVTNAFNCNPIEEVVFGEGITKINGNAFNADCNNKKDGKIEKITLPSTLTSIGDRAFKFQSLTGELIIPNGVTSIGYEAFTANKNQIGGQLIIPDSVISIGNNAFENNQITGLILGSSLQTIGNDAFNRNQLTGELIIPDSVTSIGGSAFKNNQLTGLVLGNGLSNIGNNVFENNQIEGELVIPDNVVTIGTSAFGNNKISGTLFIPGRINSGVVNNAFKDNYLEKIIFGEGVTRIDGSAFSAQYQQNSLKKQINSVEFPSTLTGIGSSAFHNQRIEGLELPDSLINIGGYAFYGNQISGTLIIPDSVTSIGQHAFNYQNNNSGRVLRSVVLGNNVQEIGSYAFMANRNLNSVYIPDSVESLSGSAFNKNKNPAYTTGYVTTKKSTLDYIGAYIKPLYQLYSYTFVNENGDILGTGYYPEILESNTTKLIPLDCYNGIGNVEDFVDVDSLISHNPGEVVIWSIPLSDHGVVTQNLIVTGSTAALHTVTFHNPYTGDITENLLSGGKVNKPAEYVVGGYQFDGWYYTGMNQKFDFENTVISEDLDLYAKYISAGVEVNVASNDEAKGTVSGSGTYNLGSKITVQAHPSIGYKLGKWIKNGKEVLSGGVLRTGESLDIEVDSALNITGVFQASGNVYRVEHYLQNLQNELYPEAPEDTDNMTGDTDAQTEAVANTYEGFTLRGNIADYQTSIQADGLTVVKLYYERNSYEVSYSYTNSVEGAPNLPSTISHKYGEEVTVLGLPALEGYTFSNSWTANGITVENGKFTMPANAVAFQGTWTARDFTITFNANGHGTAPESITQGYRTEVEAPVAPVVAGYTFGGWYTEAECDNQYEFTTMPLNGITLYAKWTANTTTQYKVEYYKQNPNDNGYTFVEEEDLTGTTDEQATVPEKNYDGFNIRSYESAIIAGDGNTVIEVKYDRAEYVITFDMDGGDALASLTGRYEQSLTAPATSELKKQGYEFSGWIPMFPEKMPLGGITLKAQWTSRGDTEYTVKYLFEDLNGNYIEKSEHPEEKKTGTTNAQTDAQAKTIAGFTAQPITQGTIKADGSTVVEVRYDRTVYNVSYLSDNEAKYTTGVKYGHTIPRIIPISLTKPGYQFQEWTGVIEMPANDVVLNAVWSPDTQTLTVNHYVMGVDGTYSNTPKDVDSTQTGKTDTQIAALSKDYGEGFSLSGAEKTVTLEAENNVVNYYYIRKQYPVTLLQSRGVKEVTITPQATSGYYYYEQPVTISAELEEGYNWSNWTGRKSSEQQITTIQEQTTGFNVPVGGVNLVANAEIQKYTVIFKNEDGTELSKTEYDYGTLPENIQRPTNPSKTATAEYTYSFAGWEPEIAKVTTGAEYTATYTNVKNKYTITWENDDGAIIDTTEVEYGIKPTHVSPSKVGHTFAGWNPTLTSVEGDKTYTATYNVNKYKVTLVKGKGVAELYGGGEYDYNTTISYTGIVKPGYHFDDGSIIKTFTQTIPANNITITVNADPNDYYVQFRKNGGIGEMENQRFIYDQTGTLNPNKFSRDGYTFVGWTNGEGGIYKDKGEVYNLATSGVVYLIAQWLEGEINPQPTPTPTPTPTPSGGSSGGGGGRIINNDVKEQEHSSAEENTGDIVQKEKNEQTDGGIKTGVNEELGGENNNKTIIDGNTKKEQQVRSQEELDAYKYAYKYGITTLAPKEAARPDEYVQRGHMAKMIVNYALNVLNRKLPTKMPKQCKWKDGRNAWESEEIKGYAEKACALGLMGIDMDYFQPYKLVTRAQFGTIFGRLLWGKLVSKPYYTEHLARLKKRGIMTQIDRPEERIEVRKWAWLMFMRSEKYFKIDK